MQHHDDAGQLLTQEFMSEPTTSEAEGDEGRKKTPCVLSAPLCD